MYHTLVRGWLKLSHVDVKVNDDILKKIKGRFGDISIQQGRKFEFMGMEITFHPYGSVSIVIENNLSVKISMFPEYASGPAPLAA